MWLEFSKWMAIALFAGFLAYFSGISISLVEIVVGFLAGNLLHLNTNQWIDFLAGMGSIILTFLSGAEIDYDVLKNKFKESMLIGIFAFLMPFLFAWGVAFWIFHWDMRAAQIAGIALSTTSVAVVYAVMIETGLNTTELGKVILAACFINDLGTVLMLGFLFANYNWWILVFIIVMIIATIVANKYTEPFFNKFGNRTYQLELKYLFLLILLCGGIANLSNMEAVLPAYILGLAMSPFFAKQKDLLYRLRAMVFGLFTPFYFLKAGSKVTFGVINYIWIVLAFLIVKMIAKYIGVRPFTIMFKYRKKEGIYTTLLMSTGLTFGTISALFGLNKGIITQSQYSILVSAVILSAVVPTMIAQKFFNPQNNEEVNDKGV
ncbi:sodium/hydrogen exchanger [Caldicellulosiruptor owensensis OL]|uniref:Sodium/hydrogen exchanger n=1 Tax=Caldicellulosiruptor owensensis (strain ATCC 700167 / DSM 13100 / OL) TaxID=632518 RepID=E4Q5Q6_CALOW|nr:cation:proton antiporter [Caldicellulosiruptor owensensis]ADQ05465.1 sodium/hydrogen exchanger [Caldicellulosiruptor owensensis OL]